MPKSLTFLVSLLICLTLAGCASRPELASRGAGNPAGVNLSGNWVLRSGPTWGDARAGEFDERVALPQDVTGSRQRTATRSSRRSRSKGPSVYVFIETGKALKISQTEHGLFVSFDRAVVEEFTFGENRTVSLGPIEAQRVSGWEAEVFVVETLDDRGALLVETWTLNADGNELVREVRIVDGDKELYATRRVFDRA